MVDANKIDHYDLLLLDNGARGAIKKPWWYNRLRRGELRSVYDADANTSFIIEPETGEIVDSFDWSETDDAPHQGSRSSSSGSGPSSTRSQR